MPPSLSLARARHAWMDAQGLLARSTAPYADLVARTGWIRTLGGCEAYLALYARAEGVTVDTAHAAVASGSLQMLPSVRGCVYLVPRCDTGVSLRIAKALSARRTARDLEKVGVEPAELDAVGDAVLSAVADGPLSTHALRKAVPDGTLRSLGAAGKKVGLTSTLPPALRRLELAGKLARRLRDDRLDHERYVWTLPDGAPLGDTAALADPAALHRALAERFFTWAGPATLDDFVSWTGLGKRDGKAAVADAGLVEVELEGVGAAYLTEATLDSLPAAPASSGVVWLPALDNLVALPKVPFRLVDPADAERTVATFGRPSTAKLGEARNLFDRVLVRDGQIVGLWAYEPDGAEVVAGSFGSALGDIEAGRVQVRDLLRAVGSGKRFSLDKDDGMAQMASRVRGMG